MHIEQNISTAYHPCTDSQTERMNLWLEQYLRLWVRNEQDKWSSYLSLVESVHNSWPHDKTGYSPHQLLIGYTLHIHQDKEGIMDIPAVEKCLCNIHEARTNATRLQETRDRSQDTSRFQEGDQVWLNAKNLKSHHETRKLAP